MDLGELRVWLEEREVCLSPFFVELPGNHLTIIPCFAILNFRFNLFLFKYK